MSEEAGRWGHSALNLALLALGVVVMALLYALVSQNLGPAGASPPAAPSSPPPTTPSAQQRATDAAPQAEPTPADEIIQVGVRNGAGESGIAAETRDHLVRAGFDVVEVGNYASFDVDSSMVIDRVGNRAAARRVARALGVPARRVRQEIGSEYHLDATVVLGRDYAALDPFRATQAVR